MIRSLTALALTLTLCLTACTGGGGDNFENRYTSLNKPDVSLAAMRDLKGNTDYPVSFTVKTGAATLDLKSLKLRYTVDGTTFVDVADISPGAESYVWHTPSIDAKVKLSLTATDSAAQATEQLSDWFEIRTTAPKFTQTLLPNYYVSSGNSVTYGSTCEKTYPISTAEVVNNVRLTLFADKNCNNGWSTTITGNADGVREFEHSETDPVGLVTTIKTTWVRDTHAPVASALALNSGAARTSTNFIDVSLKANDGLTNVTHFCLQNFAGSAPGTVAKPAADDACWIAVNSPDQPNQPLAKNFAMTNFHYRLGFSPNDYFVYAWARDEAGNVSEPVSAQIEYAPGAPPVVINVFATAADNLVLPLTKDQTTVAKNQTVFVKWNVTAMNGLSDTPVNLVYTTDDVNYQSIASATNLRNEGNGGCTVDARFTGCFKWMGAPTAGFFKVQVRVTDKNFMTTFAPSNFVNSGDFQSVAGNTDPGLGSSGTAALFFNYNDQSYRGDPNTLVVTSDGVVFFRDFRRGVLVVSPKDGTQKLLLAKTGTSSGDNGPARLAQLRDPAAIALDFSGGLLIYDYDRIRRYDIAADKITTVIGGGTDVTGDTLDPLALKFLGSNVINTAHMPFIPLPNGNLVFQSDQFRDPVGRVRIYTKATNKITTVYPRGVGDVSDPNENLQTCSSVVAGVTQPCNLSNLGIAYNPLTSAITTMHVAVIHRVSGGTSTTQANLDVTPGANFGVSKAPHPPKFGYDEFLYRVTGRDGKLYLFGRNDSTLRRYDPTTNTVTIVAGGLGYAAGCPDGTLATSCPIDPSAFYVDAQSQMYFMERGVLRTIDSAGKVVSLFGQKFFFGDGGLATSARFGMINHIGINRAGEIYAMDGKEYRIRKFTVGGNIVPVAGDGGSTRIPADNSPAEGNPLRLLNMGGTYDYFAVDPNTDDVITSQGAGYLAAIDATTKKWKNKILVGERQYSPLPIGLGPTGFLFATWRFDYPTALTSDELFKSMPYNNVSGGNVETVAGALGRVGSVICPDGTPGANCLLPNATFDASYDAATGGWFVLQSGTNTVRSIKKGGNFGTLTTLSQGAVSFTIRHRANQPDDMIYCGGNGVIYRRLLPANLNNAADTAIPLPVSAAKCTGRKIILNAAQDTVYFPYFEQGLNGVASLKLPNF